MAVLCWRGERRERVRLRERESERREGQPSSSKALTLSARWRIESIGGRCADDTEEEEERNGWSGGETVKKSSLDCGSLSLTLCPLLCMDTWDTALAFLLCGSVFAHLG
jgi:hypothetical protein